VGQNKKGRNMTTTEIEKAKIIEQLDDLKISKREHETKLVTIKNQIRGCGLLPPEKYRQCVASQVQHQTAILKIERLLQPLKKRLRELSSDDRSNQDNGSFSTPPSDVKGIVEDLVELRKDYQFFAADSTRISSMRQMAAEFVVKLNPIIKRAIK
jgi:hypothetical protein